MPKISIIIPVYNNTQTILETIASIQEQTFSDWEIIIINDGSTDHILELLETVTEEQMRIFSYENSGISTARNRGIEQSQGEFISFLDADDLWTRDKLELQLAALQNQPQAGVAYSWTVNMNATGDSFWHGSRETIEGNVYQQLLVSNFLANGSNPLIRREAIASVGQFDPEMFYCGDWDYYLRLAASWDFVVVPKAQILYRHYATSASTKIDIMEKSCLAVLDKTLNNAPAELQVLKNRSKANIYLYLTGLQLANVVGRQEVKEAAYRLWQAISCHPPLFFASRTQKYLSKLLMMQITSPQFTKTLTQKFTSTSKISDPRI